MKAHMAEKALAALLDQGDSDKTAVEKATAGHRLGERRVRLNLRRPCGAASIRTG